MRPVSVTQRNTGLRLEALAQDPDADRVSYEWRAMRGSISGQGSSVVWFPMGPAPTSESVLLTVQDPYQASIFELVVFKIDPNTFQVDVAPGATFSPVEAAPPITKVDLVDGIGRVDRVTISASLGGSSILLDALESDGLADTGFVTSASFSGWAHLTTGTRTSFVRWTSSDPQRLKIDWRGIAQVQAGADAGVVDVIAESFLDPSKRATFPVEIRSRGAVGVDIQ